MTITKQQLHTSTTSQVDIKLISNDGFYVGMEKVCHELQGYQKIPGI